MDPAILATALRALGDLMKLMPNNQAAKQQIELLKEQINLVERQIRAIETEKSRLQAQVDDQNKELAELRERFAEVSLATDEIERDRMLWRLTKGQVSGPFCINHRDTRMHLVGRTALCPICGMKEIIIQGKPTADLF